MTTTTTKFPWEGLPTSANIGEYQAKQVAEGMNPKHRPVFWGCNWMGHPALIVEYGNGHPSALSLPEFKNMLVKDYPEDKSLVVELLDNTMSDLFLQVCSDIISILQDVPSADAMNASLLRLGRWSSLLKPSRSRLSRESQKGLIAELLFLRNDMFDVYSPDDTLSGWTGPDAGPRDFAYGQVFIEVKSKRSSANPHIVISSEEQLNINPSERLFLYVKELNDIPPDDEGGFTLTDVVVETRESLGSPLLKAEFDNKLAEVGYFDEDDYSNDAWSSGADYYYEVVEGFPRIDSHSCAPGVSGVSYQVDLDYCDDYLVERSVLIETMEK